MKKSSAIIGLTISACALPVAAGPVDITFDGPTGPVELCSTIDIDLTVSEAGASGQPFNGMDVILNWDPSLLEFIGLDGSNAAPGFFVTDFLNDPDDVNDDTSDGEAILTALASPGTPVVAPPSPATLIVTTLQFRALDQGTFPEVSIAASVGVFGETQVIFGGNNFVGDISDVAVVTAGSCAADFDVNGVVAFNDLLRLLSIWGTCPDSCCPEDINGDGNVTFTDLVQLLSDWGPC